MKKPICRNYQYFIFAIITILANWPVVINISSRLWADPGDPFGNLWRLWWQNYAHLNNLNPYFVNIINYPHGLALDNFAISISQIAAKYISFISNEIFAYNLVIILSIFLSGASMFWLVCYLTKNKMASIFAGILYMFSPYLLSHANQHLELAGIFWFPLIILYLLKLSEKICIKNILLCALFLAGAIMQSFYYAYMVLVIIIAYLVFYVIYRFIKRENIFNFLGTIIIAGIISLLFSLPFTWNTYYNLFGNNKESVKSVQTRSRHELTVYSAQYFNYTYPSPENPFFGKYTQEKFAKLVKETGSNLTEQVIYLGWINIFLCVFAIWFFLTKKIKKDIKVKIGFFIFLGLVFFYFSFAPEMDIFGLRIKTPANYIFDHLPYFRVYARFGIIVFLSVTVLAGMSLSFILDHIKKNQIKIFGMIILTTIAVLEFINFPPYHWVDLKEKSAPKVYQFLKSQPTGVIAEYPLLPTSTPIGYSYYLWQRYHQMPLLYGARIKTSDDDIRKELSNPEKDEVIKKLKKIGVNYLIIHSDMYNEYIARFFPEEDNFGHLPIITSPQLEIINNFDGDILYKFKN